MGLFSGYEDGLGEALADLDGAISSLEGFDALTEGVKIALPVALGGGVAFGTVAALDYFIEPGETKDAIMPYKWLIGAAVGAAAGLAVYKFAGETAGVVTIAGSLVTAAVGWGLGKLAEGSTATPGLSRYQPGAPGGAMGRYRLGAPATAALGGFGRYAYSQPYGNVVM